MSWAEIMEIQLELKDIRKKVGGAAKKFDKNNIERSIEDDVNELKDDLKDLREAIKDLREQLKAIDNQGTAQQDDITRVVDILKASNDKLEKAVDEAD